MAIKSGDVFLELRVDRKSPGTDHWACSCVDCGASFVVRGFDLRNHNVACGCAKVEEPAPDPSYREAASSGKKRKKKKN